MDSKLVLGSVGWASRVAVRDSEPVVSEVAVAETAEPAAVAANAPRKPRASVKVMEE